MARRQMVLSVVTPERRVLEERTDALVVVPAYDGEMGILPGRAPLMCELGIGQLRYQIRGRMHRVFVDGGFVQVCDDRIHVLADRAVPAEEIHDALLAREQEILETPAGTDPQRIAARQQARRRLWVLRQMRAAGA